MTNLSLVLDLLASAVVALYLIGPMLFGVLFYKAPRLGRVPSLRCSTA